MKRAEVFQRSTYDPNTQQSSAVFTAAAQQVRANFKADRLAQQHSAGRINDHKYIKELKNLTQEYRKFTGLHRELRGEVVGAAQQIAGTYQSQIQENQVQFLDDALRTFNQASTDYSAGVITAQEFKQASDLYKAALSGKRPEPTLRETTRQILKGKYWDQYKSGRVRNIMREKQIKGIFKAVTGDTIDKERLNTLASGEGSKAYIQQQLINEQGLQRDLSKEQAAVTTLLKRLGRLPTAEEIKTEVYG